MITLYTIWSPHRILSNTVIYCTSHQDTQPSTPMTDYQLMIYTRHIFFFFFIVMIFFSIFFLTLVQIIEINCCFLNHQGQVTLIFMPLILSLFFFLNVYINLSGRNDDFKVVTSEVSQGNFREQFSAQNDKMLVCLFVFFLRTLSVFIFFLFFLFQQNPTTACRC